MSRRLEDAKEIVERQATGFKREAAYWPLELAIKVIDQIDIWVEHEFEKLEAQEEERG